jgi:hypothetical protein
MRYNAHRNGMKVLRETCRPMLWFQKRLRVPFDASGAGATSYVAAGGPDRLEYWPEEVLRCGVGRKMQQGMPAQAAVCSAMIYVESISIVVPRRAWLVLAYLAHVLESSGRQAEHTPMLLTNAMLSTDTWRLYLSLDKHVE